MCGRYTLTRNGRLHLSNRFGPLEIREEERFRFPLFNISPTEQAPVILEEDGKRTLELMSFGLVPHWAKDVKIAAQCINARAETVAEKPAFRDAFKKRRCLVVADGYYEWKHEGKLKIPHRVVMKSNDLFAFAGLWDIWRRPDGRELRSFAIITTETNGLTREFHERMPVILKREDEPLWIANAVTEARTLKPLLRPYPVDEMRMDRLRTLVNSPFNKDAAVIEPDPN